MTFEHCIELLSTDMPSSVCAQTQPSTTGRDGFRLAGDRPRRSWLRAVLWVVVAAAASGCTTPYEGRYDFYEGWRKAEVTRLDVFEKLAPHLIPRCASALPSEAAAGSRWALVRYRAGRRHRQVAVPLASADDYQIGELVYVNVSDCSRAIRRRTTSS